MVNEEYRKYMSMNNENDIIAHFTIQGPHSFFICLLWQMLLETNRITSIAYKWVLLSRVPSPTQRTYPITLPHHQHSLQVGTPLPRPVTHLYP